MLHYGERVRFGQFSEGDFLPALCSQREEALSEREIVGPCVGTHQHSHAP